MVLLILLKVVSIAKYSLDAITVKAEKDYVALC